MPGCCAHYRYFPQFYTAFDGDLLELSLHSTDPGQQFPSRQVYHA